MPHINFCEVPVSTTPTESSSTGAFAWLRTLGTQGRRRPAWHAAPHPIQS